MSFLYPIWLLGLPLVLLPIVIHLWNQRRHKTIQWGAMQFLLSAKRMSRGLARLRHWLIMAARMMAVAAIILIVTRPLSTGWLGMLSSGQPQTVLILLDRSASMQQQRGISGESKLQAGTQKIVAALETLGATSQIYLVDALRPVSPTRKNGSNDVSSTTDDSSTALGDSTNDPSRIEPNASGSDFGNVIPITRPRDLLDLPEATSTDSQVNLPTMLQTALDFVTNNQTGRTDIWICSDGAENDWSPDSSRWQALNSGFSKLEGIRFHYLNYSDLPTENLSIRVDHWERVTQGTQPELIMDLTIRRTGSATQPVEVPVTIDIGGVRSVVKVNLEGEAATLTGQRIPLDLTTTAGWGSVEIPADANPIDNRYYFAFAESQPLQAIVITDRPEQARAIELAAAVAAGKNEKAMAAQVTPDRVNEIDWAKTSLIVWQGPMPRGEVADRLTRFIENGRAVIFLPPENPDGTSFAGWSWSEWQQTEGTAQKMGYWNNDADLLMRTRDGRALPVDELSIYRYCKLNGSGRVLAKMDNGDPLLIRMTASPGPVYALTTLPVGTHSSLDREGITLYVLVQRALAAGAESQGQAKLFEAGSSPAMRVAVLPVLASGSTDHSGERSGLPMMSELKPFLAGVYGGRDEFVALNRPVAEEQAPLLGKDVIDRLFAGLDFHLISDQLDNERSLASEIWKFFAVAIVLALLVEAVFCLPDRVRQSSAASSLPSRAAA